jgi:uncharacterized protein
MRYKPSHYFSLFEGKGDQPAVSINTLTGGTYAFTPDILAKVRSLLSDPNCIDTGLEEVRNFFIQERIIIPEDFDELEYLKAVHRAGRHSDEELYVTYSMTNACNFRCTYCYQAHSKDVLNDAGIAKTLKYIEKQLPKYKNIRVHWFGGEPLLRLRWIESASRQIRQLCDSLGKGYFAGITTNGSLFDRKTAAILKGLGIGQVQFTLDGAEIIHNSLRIKKNGKGSYDIVMSAIETAIQFEFYIFIRINLSLRATTTLRDLLLDFDRRGWGPKKFTIYINEMKQHSNSMVSNNIYFPSVAEYAEHFVDALRLLKEYGYPLPQLAPVDVNCAFDKPSSVLFGTDGNLYHCTTGTDRALGVIDDAGNIIEEAPRRQAIHSREPWDDPHCATCKSLPTCMGGCAYLDEEGKTKCNPEGFVVEQLIRLSLPTESKEK